MALFATLGAYAIGDQSTYLPWLQNASVVTLQVVGQKGRTRSFSIMDTREGYPEQSLTSRRSASNFRGAG